MNDGAVKAILLVMGVVTALGLAGIALAIYLKQRLATTSRQAADVKLEILFVLAMTMLLFGSSVCLALMFLDDYRFSWGSYLQQLTLSAVKFLIVTSLTLVVARKVVKSKLMFAKHLAWGAVGATMVLYPWSKQLSAANWDPLAAVPLYAQELSRALWYPLDLMATLVTDPGWLVYRVESEFWTRFGNYFEMMDLYGPFFFAVMLYSATVSVLSYFLSLRS